MTGVLVAAVVATAPILIAALGGLVSERAGVMAIGLEGFMIAGAFAGEWAGHAAGTVAGVTGAVVAGLLLGLLTAILCVTLRANQVVVGVAVILLATGGTGYLNYVAYNGQIVSLAGLPSVAVPGLSHLGIVGRVLFDQPSYVYVAVALAVGFGLYFRYTTSGLALHAVGENPFAAQARGIRVIRTRYAAVLACGVLAALAGAVFTIGQGLQFSPTISSGRGFIALAAIYLGGRRVLPVFTACLVFGLADVAQIWASVIGLNIPSSILATVPYLVTLAALMLLRARTALPGGLGVPFFQEQRIAAE